MTDSKTLTDLKEGESAVVSRVAGSSAIKQRLMDMGIMRGTEVRIERYAPLKDPIHIRVKGYSLAIRVAEGELIEVK